MGVETDVVLIKEGLDQYEYIDATQRGVARYSKGGSRDEKIGNRGFWGTRG